MSKDIWKQIRLYFQISLTKYCDLSYSTEVRRKKINISCWLHLSCGHEGCSPTLLTLKFRFSWVYFTFLYTRLTSLQKGAVYCNTDSYWLFWLALRQFYWLPYAVCIRVVPFDWIKMYTFLPFYVCFSYLTECPRVGGNDWNTYKVNDLRLKAERGSKVCVFQQPLGPPTSSALALSQGVYADQNEP